MKKSGRYKTTHLIEDQPEPGSRGRVLKNKLADMILQAEREGLQPEEVQEMIGAGRSVKACLEGNLDEGSFMSGQIAGMIHDLKSAREIVKELMEGCEEIFSYLKEGELG